MNSTLHRPCVEGWLVRTDARSHFSMPLLGGALGLYKIGTGLYLLSLNWSLFSDASQPGLSLLLAMLTSYGPAALAPWLTGALRQRITGRSSLAALLLCVSVMTACNLTLFNSIPTRLATNVIVWLCYFALEAFFDQEWAKETQMHQRNVPRMSATYLLLTQTMMIVGTTLVSPLQDLAGFRGIGIIVGATYFLAAAAAIASGRITVASQTSARSPHSAIALIPMVPSESVASLVRNNFAFFLGLGMIWGFLAVFNMMTPTFGPRMSQGNGLATASALSVSLAMGMTLAALLALVPRATQIFSNQAVAGCLGAFVTLLLVATGLTMDMLLGLGTSALLGVWFGMARMQLRTQMTERLHHASVSRFVARANAFCVATVLFFGGVFALEIETGQTRFFAPALTLAVFTFLVAAREGKRISAKTIQ